MCKTIQDLPLRFVVENNGPELRTIEGAVREEDVLSEVLRYLSQYRAPRFYDLTRDEICVHNREPIALELI